MTYRQLLRVLQDTPDYRLDDTVTVYNPTLDEFTDVTRTGIADENQIVLDEDHLYLVLTDHA